MYRTKLWQTAALGTSACKPRRQAVLQHSADVHQLGWGYMGVTHGSWATQAGWVNEEKTDLLRPLCVAVFTSPMICYLLLQGG